MADLTLQETRSIVQQTILTFQPASDIELIRTADRDISEATENWERHLHDDQELLRALNRKMEIAKSEATRPLLGEDGLTHAERVIKLDHEKFETAKNLNDMEATINSLNAKIEKLREESERLDNLDVEKELPPDPTILKLQIYRSLGIELLDDGAGKFSKARICSAPKNDIHTVAIDDKFSNYFYANYLWDMCT